MGRVTFNAAQVPINPVYNWAFVDPTIGMLDIGWVSTDAPGVAPINAGATTGLQNIATSVLPRPIFQQQLGQIVRAYDPILGFGEFIYLAVPLSTAIPLGTLVSYDFGAGLTSAQSASNPVGGSSTTNANLYAAVVVPVKATSQKTGAPVAVCISSTVQTNTSPPSGFSTTSNIGSGLGITSNASSWQYAWFQIGGTAQVLKTAIQVAPVTTENSAGVYISTSAGRIYTTASTGGQILGARLANTTTVTTTASCVLVYLNGRPALEGF
jgi:hypothetical protein